LTTPLPFGLSPVPTPKKASPLYCSEHSTVNRGPQAGVAISLRCKCWHCEMCQPINRGRVIHRAKRGDPSTFITLTSNPALYKTPDEAARAMVRGWRALRRRIARKQGRDQIPFIAVFEATKAGWPHLHILARAGWIDQRWLSATWKELTGAFIVDIRAIQDRGRAAAYVSKYVGKDPHRFIGTQRFWNSRDWQIDREEADQRPALPSDRWWKIEAPLAELANALAAQGVPFEWHGHRITWGDGTQ